MEELHTLREALARAIIEYHQKKTRAEAPAFTEDQLQRLMTKPQEEVIAGLKKLIDETTVTSTRQSLMHYLLNTFETIHVALVSSIPFSAEEQASLVETLTAFLTNIKTLLQTSQSTFIEVKCGEDIIKINGLCRSLLGLFHTTHVESGLILQHLFSSFSRNPNETAEHIKDKMTVLIQKEQIKRLEAQSLPQVTQAVLPAVRPQGEESAAPSFSFWGLLFDGIKLSAAETSPEAEISPEQAAYACYRPD